MGKKYFIIGRSTCPFCVMAEDLMIASKIEYVFMDYNRRQSMLDDYKEFYNHPTVPIILSNDIETGLTKFVGGYTQLLEHLGGN